MIPKKIHYIWLGEKPKSKLTEICINTWRRNLIDYQIYEWNESNLNLIKLCSKNLFLKKCYEMKLWAFVSDYIRLYILYNEGGIYLDTDVEVIRNFDGYLYDKMFLGYEVDEYVGTAVIGAEPGHPTIKRLLDFYEKDIWNVNFFNNPIIFKYLKKKEPDIFMNCKIYPMDKFSPYCPNVTYIKPVETANTVTIHWYTKVWNLSCKGYIFLNTKHIKNPLKKKILQLKKLFGYFRYREICKY